MGSYRAPASGVAVMKLRLTHAVRLGVAFIFDAYGGHASSRRRQLDGFSMQVG
jgi:hypothetical protein